MLPRSTAAGGWYGGRDGAGQEGQPSVLPRSTAVDGVVAGMVPGRRGNPVCCPDQLLWTVWWQGWCRAGGATQCAAQINCWGPMSLVAGIVPDVRDGRPGLLLVRPLVGQIRGLAWSVGGGDRQLQLIIIGAERTDHQDPYTAVKWCAGLIIRPAAVSVLGACRPPRAPI